MSNIQAVSYEAHANKFWRRYTSYAFSATQSAVPLAAQELPRALMHLPISFIKQDDEFVLVAVLGFQPGKNLFVTAEGRWIGGYTPAALRSYPFLLGKAEDGQRVLAVDEDSGLVNDSDGESFFDEDGNPAKALQDVFDFLGKVESNRLLTQKICAVLAEHQLIQPWPLTVQSNNGELKVEGLHSIDEKALNALPSEAFESLRQEGALLIAYCQLLSMSHIPTLGRLADAHHKAEQSTSTSLGAELDLEFLNDSGSINFGS